MPLAALPRSPLPANTRLSSATTRQREQPSTARRQPSRVRPEARAARSKRGSNISTTASGGCGGKFARYLGSGAWESPTRYALTHTTPPAIDSSIRNGRAVRDRGADVSQPRPAGPQAPTSIRLGERRTLLAPTGPPRQSRTPTAQLPPPTPKRR